MMRGVRPRGQRKETEATRAALRWQLSIDPFALAWLLNKDRGAGNALSMTLHHPLCNYVQTTPFRKNLYLLPRGHLKTSILTVARNIQRILQNPQVRILIASNKAENAEAMLSELKGHLTNQWLLFAFPDILYEDPARQAPRWTTNAITVKRKIQTKEATVEAIGVTGELTSKHYDHGTFDDVVGKENSQTRDGLQGAIDFLRIAESLFDPGSTQDYVGTPWHYADAYAWLLEQREKHGMELGVYRIPCFEADANGEHAGPLAALYPQSKGRVRPIFPERFSVAELLRIRAMKGPSEFSAQYLLDPVSKDTAYFPRDQILPNIRPRRELPDPATLWTVMTIDPAISQKAWADYSAIAVNGWDTAGMQYCLDLRRGRWTESELIDKVYDAYHRTPGIKAIGIEAVGFARIFRTAFWNEAQRRGEHLPIVSLPRDTRITKAVRLRGLEPIWHARELVLAADLEALEDFLYEAEVYRPDKDNAHDDMLDAMVDAIELRLRPIEEEAPRWTEDTELLERIDLERSIQQQRAAAGQQALDASALRMAARMAQRLQKFEEEAEVIAGEGSSPYAEFVA